MSGFRFYVCSQHIYRIFFERQFLCKACHKKLIKIIFAFKLRRIFPASIGTAAHRSITLLSRMDQIHHIDRIPKLLAFPAECIHRILLFTRRKQHLPEFGIPVRPVLQLVQHFHGIHLLLSPFLVSVTQYNPIFRKSIGKNRNLCYDSLYFAAV